MVILGLHVKRAAAAALLVALLAGCSGTDPAPAASSPPPSPDRAFVSGMVPHHQAAVDMAQVELARGTNPQVRALAQSILTDQQREITQMTELAQQRYGFAPNIHQGGPMGELMGQPITMDMSMMGPMVSAGPNVDHVFLTGMIPHHAAAVVMADAESSSGTDPQLKVLSGSIVASQSQQIGQMQAMLTAGA